MEKILYNKKEYEKAKDNILELLEFSNKNEVITLDYLIRLAKKLDCISKIGDSIFDFNPTYDEKGRNQTFANYYIEQALSNIIWELNYRMVKKIKPEITKIEIEDIYLLNWFDEYLENKNTNKWSLFLKNKNILFSNKVNNKKELIENDLETIISIWTEKFFYLLLQE